MAEHMDGRRFVGRFSVWGALVLFSIVALAAVAAAAVWPGPADVGEVDTPDASGGNMSGLVYEGTGTATPGILWEVRNGPGELHRLLWDGSVWAPDPSNGWVSGKSLRFPGGGGDVDAEGVTIADGDSTSVYVASERDNDDNGVSRPSILRYDVTGTATSLDATDEWDLTADLPESEPNGGIESITWVPDVDLVAAGFFDDAAGQIYQPNDYPNHGTGLFFVGHEPTGDVYAYALDHLNSTVVRITSFSTGLPRIMALDYDTELGHMWAACDGNCMGALSRLVVDVNGDFIVEEAIDRPAVLPDENNEGFALTPLVECVGGLRPVYWADDNETDGHALRRGSLDCPPPPPVFCDGLVVTVKLGAGEVPTAGDDVILGTSNTDVIDALAGNDVVCGMAGDDFLAGGAGDDVLIGGPGFDLLDGQQGDDTLHE